MRRVSARTLVEWRVFLAKRAEIQEAVRTGAEYAFAYRAVWGLFPKTTD